MAKGFRIYLQTTLDQRSVSLVSLSTFDCNIFDNSPLTDAKCHARKGDSGQAETFVSFQGHEVFFDV